LIEISLMKIIIPSIKYICCIQNDFLLRICWWN